MMLMASKPEVMGEHTIPASLRIVGWIAVAIMVLGVIAMAATSLT
jgi:Mn2+/Fe2+ NRAMP family transporter